MSKSRMEARRASQGDHQVIGLKNHARRGGEEIGAGTLHGGEEIGAGTLHGGEEIGAGTLHSSSVNQEEASASSFSPDQISAGTLYSDYGTFILPSNVTREGLFLYRTKDGLAYFIFDFVWRNNHYVVDIISMPGYHLSNWNYEDTHRLISVTPYREQICFAKGKEPKDKETVQNYAKDWAELTWVYIKTGESIDKQIKKRIKKAKAQNKASELSWLDQMLLTFS